jgi:hypothetical protein
MEQQEKLSSLLLDVYDLKRAIPQRVKAMPKDNEGTDFTIGEVIDDIIETLEELGA